MEKIVVCIKEILVERLWVEWLRFVFCAIVIPADRLAFSHIRGAEHPQKKMRKCVAVSWYYSPATTLLAGCVVLCRVCGVSRLHCLTPIQ